MTDSFKEQIIKKERTQKDTYTKAVIMFSSLALAFGIILFALNIPRLAVIGIFLAALSIYGGFYLCQNLDLEYEYIYTNGDLDVDKIIAQRSRKRLITVNVKEASDIGKADDAKDSERTVVVASARREDMEDYYLDVKHRDYGNVRVIFTPDEDMLRVIKSGLPRNLRNKIQVADKPVDEEE